MEKNGCFVQTWAVASRGNGEMERTGGRNYNSVRSDNSNEKGRKGKMGRAGG